MKVYVVGVSMAYLGNEIFSFGSGIKDLEKPKFNHSYYDKIGNNESYWYYYETQEEADSSYFTMFRKLKELRGINNFPESWKEMYDTVYNRAATNYPEIV